MDYCQLTKDELRNSKVARDEFIIKGEIGGNIMHIPPAKPILYVPHNLI